MTKFKVTFQPENETVEVEKDRTILSAALSVGIYLNSSCGADGVCGRCKVILRRGKVVAPDSGLLSAEEKQKGIYLACLTHVLSDIEVEIPAESRLDLGQSDRKELEEKLKGISLKAEDAQFATPAARKFIHAPLTQKIYENKNTVTLSLRNKTPEVLFMEAGNTAKRNFGLAFDIGTTTISGQLINLVSQEILGTKALYNRQAAYGADVITRIIFAEKSAGLQKLHTAVASCMNEIIADLVREHRIDLNDVTCVLCAGNTTMIHLLLRIEPGYIRRLPYVHKSDLVTTLRAIDAGIVINPHGLLSCVAGIASYVGGDVTSGTLSTGQYQKEDLSLLIDIGTNGEVVLGNKEFLIATSASAGPAFEGSGVSCGMRSAPGAIQKVKIDKDFNASFETIGAKKPRGICGSGYIDIIAEMLKAGILDKDGKIKSLKDKRIRDGETGKEFVIAAGSAGAGDIIISETDIDNIKRAKAAIYAACNILVRHLSLDFSKVEKIFIAGGFGTSLDIKNAVRIGLLPDLPLERFVFVGNSSLAGTQEIILSKEACDTADEIACKMTYLELSTEPAYMDEYMAALFFPHTDLSRFSTIKF
jgi:uncharacterized 2Fe-2S/4Fe-4S cluster protein (DUF4445 family)